MSNYLDVIYSNKSNYDQKLCSYLKKRYAFQGSLLDVGCGTGSHVNSFRSLGLNAVGIDYPQYDFECDRFDIHGKSVNDVFSKSVIEHINNPDKMIKEIWRVMKPLGKLVIMTPDWNSQMKHFWDDYTHKHPYTPKSLKDLLLIHGFNNVKVELFYQLPFIWKFPFLKFVPKLISLLPDCLKWKTKNQRNGEDRKLIRFSKEKMILISCTK